MHFSHLKAFCSYASCLSLPAPFFSCWPWHDGRLAGAPRGTAPWSLPLRLCQHPPSASLAPARGRVPSPAFWSGALVASPPPQSPLSPLPSGVTPEPSSDPALPFSPQPPMAPLLWRMLVTPSLHGLQGSSYSGPARPALPVLCLVLPTTGALLWSLLRVPRPGVHGPASCPSGCQTPLPACGHPTCHWD